VLSALPLADDPIWLGLAAARLGDWERATAALEGLQDPIAGQRSAAASLIGLCAARGDRRARSMLAALRDWHAADRPLYAECGGLMLLSQGIELKDGRLGDQTPELLAEKSL
jgi:hypothetical protein